MRHLSLAEIVAGDVYCRDNWSRQKRDRTGAVGLMQILLAADNTAIRPPSRLSRSLQPCPLGGWGLIRDARIVATRGMAFASHLRSNSGLRGGMMNHDLFLPMVIGSNGAPNGTALHWSTSSSDHMAGHPLCDWYAIRAAWNIGCICHICR